MSGSLSGRDFGRVLIIKPSALGDVIHTVPVLVKLRRRYPRARIDWLLAPGIAEWIGRHPDLTEAVPFDRGLLARCWRSPSAVRGLAALLLRLRRARYDLVLDLHGQFRSALFALATGARVRIGFDRPRQTVIRSSQRSLPEAAYRHGWTGAREAAWLAYTHRIELPTLDAHAIDRYLWVGRLLGFDDRPPEMAVPIPEAARLCVASMLGTVTGPLAVLNPGTQWETKRWSAEGFAEVARHLCGRGYVVALAGAPSERAVSEQVARSCPGVIDLTGRTTVSELAALVERATVCVTNDSGPMHLAVALRRPVVSVFGPTDELWIGPYGRSEAVVRQRLECAPCYLRAVRRCPNGHACMRGVTAEAVIARLELTLARRAA